MTQSLGDNKRIAQNTLLLYIRMFVLMAVNLFTSRIVLQCLGVEDFGIYGIVGSIVVLFSFLNSAMSTCTSRFLSFYIGKKDNSMVNKIFSASLNLYLLVILIILLLAETIGLYIVNNILNIPENKMVAVNIVYQFSILTFCSYFIKIPYNAAIVSYERMDFYAYLSIADVMLKLGGVYLLYIFSGNRLELYALIMFLISSIITFAYYLYCHQKFSDTHYHGKNIDKLLYKQLFGFSGWSMLSGIANIGSNTGVNMILNVFCGVTVNAAVSIANQVSNAMFSFVSNFQTAFTPQITKLYATGEKGACYRLVYHSSKFSYYLFGVLILPLIIAMPSLLAIWLGTVPQYAVEFTNLILVYMLIDALFCPLWLFVDATGNIRTHQIVTGLLILSNFPIAYILQKMELSPNSVWYARIVINVIANVFRLVYMLRVFRFPSFMFISKVLLPVVITSLLVVLPTWYSYKFFDAGFVSTATFIILSFIFSSFVVYVVGLSKPERVFINNIIISKVKKYKN